MGAEQIDVSKIEDAHVSCDLVTPHPEIYPKLRQVVKEVTNKDISPTSFLIAIQKCIYQLAIS